MFRVIDEPEEKDENENGDINSIVYKETPSNEVEVTTGEKLIIFSFLLLSKSFISINVISFISSTLGRHKKTK